MRDFILTSFFIVIWNWRLYFSRNVSLIPDSLINSDVKIAIKISNGNISFLFDSIKLIVKIVTLVLYVSIDDLYFEKHEFKYENEFKYKNENYNENWNTKRINDKSYNFRRNRFI